MAAFKRLDPRGLRARGEPRRTEESQYWNSFEFPVTIKEFGAIDYIDFCPVFPHYFAVTCSAKVNVYHPVTHRVHKNLSRFKETAYGGSFRADGRLLCAGSEEGFVRLFDVPKKSLLRIFKGHQSPVHRCKFACDSVQIASFSDDKSVKLWDIPSEKEVWSTSSHTDYVRAGGTSPVSPHLISSGSYDHNVHLYDVRSQEASPLTTFEHGFPVEAVLFLPSGALLASAGGPVVKVWDLSAQKCLATLVQHHKTVTCLSYAPLHGRLCSGSLDRHVKLYDLTNFAVVHDFTFPSPVLSFAVSPTDDTIVSGSVDGFISIQHHQQKGPALSEKEGKTLKHKDPVPPPDALVIPQKITRKEPAYEKCLRKFDFSQALEKVLFRPTLKKIHQNPEEVVAVFVELLRRDGLRAAVAGHSGTSLHRLFVFICIYMGDPRFTHHLVDVANVVLDVYGPHCQLSEYEEGLKHLERCLTRLLNFTKELLQTQGVIQMLCSSSSLRATTSTGDKPWLPPDEGEPQEIVTLE